MARFCPWLSKADIRYLGELHRIPCQHEECEAYGRGCPVYPTRQAIAVEADLERIRHRDER